MDALKAAVSKRAGFRCEYCHMPVHPDLPPFHLEHIIAGQHGGQAVLHNLALSCSLCNFHKGPNIAGVDPRTRRKCFLFDPRKEHWGEHFERKGSRIVGKTVKGRTPVATLGMNGEDRVVLRQALIEEGILPASE